MKYTYKEKVIMARKLKVFLAIFFAAITFFTGKIILDKTFAEDRNYGTATITFNSGTDGEFEDGSTTNVVTYNLIKQTTKYSHTPNISDDGTQNSNYGDNLSLNDVVTIPGASTLHVVITYGGESATYDWACVWEGAHSNYTASSNSSLSVSGKLGGGIHTNPSNTVEYDIVGDSVTFGFRSDGSSCGDGYGYYAVITGENDNGDLALGSVASGEYKEPIPYNSDWAFDKWNPELSTVTSSTTITAVYKDAIASGTYDGVDWKITARNVLIIGKVGVTQTFTYSNSRATASYPWYPYRGQILSVYFEGPVNGNGSMGNMFNGCNNVVTIDVNNFMTTDVIDMNHMFCDCQEIISLDLSGFDTSNVTNMSWMFGYCKKLTSLDVSNFNTEKVITMSYMFYDLVSISTLDVSSFNTTSVTTMASMFHWCINLIVLEWDNDLFVTDNVTDINTFLAGNSKLQAIDVSEFNTSNVTNMNRMFDGCSSLANIDVSGFNTSNVRNISYMFTNCSSLSNIDVSGFNTSNVTNMARMFNECSSLSNIDVSGFNTSNVTNMERIFDGCSSLSNIDVSGFNTSSVTDMSYMFSGCKGLTELDLTNFNTSSVIYMDNMLANMPKLKTIKLGTDWNFLSTNGLEKSWIRDGDTTIYTASELINLYDGSTMAGTYRAVPDAFAEIDSSTGQLRIFRDDPGKYTNGQTIGTKTYYSGIENISDNPKWYNVRSIITSVVIEDYFKPRTAYNLFGGCSELTSVTGIENIDLINATSTYNMFYGCSSLTTLDLSMLDTTTIEDMTYMFGGCKNLISLDLGNFNTSNVTNMFGMFISCSSLTTLNVSSFDTSNVTDMDNMFLGCKNLISLDVSNFDTSNVTTMFAMFSNCNSLTSLDVSNFDTSNVTTFTAMFSQCTNILTLDLSSFNTSNVTNMSSMFDGCTNLTSVDVSSFNTSNVTNINQLFCYCSSLISADLSNFNTSSVTNMDNVFRECTNLISIDVSSFDTSNVTEMAYMFSGCSNLQQIDISSFDATGVTDMKFMFSSCTKLNTLKIGTNWKFLSNCNLSKSWLRDGDTIVYTANQLINSYNGATMAGTYRAVVRLTITEEVRGSLADINKNFNFNINVQKDGNGINSTHSYSGTRSGNLTFSNGNATFSLKHGENIIIILQQGLTYAITQDSDGYSLSQTYNPGTLNDDVTSTFVDTLNGTTPSGIFIDLIPFIIFITFGICGLLLIRKFKYIN